MNSMYSTEYIPRLAETAVTFMRREVLTNLKLHLGITKLYGKVKT